MAFLLDQVSLYEALAFLFVGVSGVAIGLGWQWVGSVLREREKDRALETAGIRITKLAGEHSEMREQMAEMREEMAVIRAEFKMQGNAMLAAQRELESKNTELVELRHENMALQRELIALKAPAAQNFYVGGDVNNGGDITAHDKTVTPR